MKKAIAMPFNWIFAIIVGGTILLLAIYGASKVIGTGEQLTYTETSAKLVSLLDPLETGLASGKSEQINFKKDTRTYYTCSYLDNKPFGKQTLSFSEKTIGDKFGERGGEITIRDKYVFAENIVEGKNLYVFSKPLFMPFKVADLIFISSKDYCFYQAPNEIKKEIEQLNLGNIYFSDDLENCSERTKICFDSSKNCEIKVFGLCQGSGCKSSYDYGKILKEDEEVYYVGSLIFGGIFSSSKIYECNLKRIMNRFNELSLVYLDKIKITERMGCSSTISSNLMVMMESAKALKSSKELVFISEQSKDIDRINSGSSQGCALY